MKTSRNHQKTFALVTAVVVGLALVQAPRARAGDQEWAVVGKVLTGVVAAHILLGEPEIRSRAVVVHREVPRPLVHVSRACSPRAVVKPRGRAYGHVKGGAARRCNARYRHDRCGNAGGPALIRQLSRTRRIYQPRVRGHVAFIQERPCHGHDWVTVRKCHSIW